MRYSVFPDQRYRPKQSLGPDESWGSKSLLTAKLQSPQAAFASVRFRDEAVLMPMSAMGAKADFSF